MVCILIAISVPIGDPRAVFSQFSFEWLFVFLLLSLNETSLVAIVLSVHWSPLPLFQLIGNWTAFFAALWTFCAKKH